MWFEQVNFKFFYDCYMVSCLVIFLNDQGFVFSLVYKIVFGEVLFVVDWVNFKVCLIFLFYEDQFFLGFFLNNNYGNKIVL